MRALLWLALASVWPAAAIAQVPAPVPVSPGLDSGVALISQSCPTFSWEATSGASSVDLVVYRLSDGQELELRAEQLRPLIEQRLPGGASAWTPSLASCLERGGRYAWSIRSVGAEGEGEWATPRLFELAGEPSLEEVEAAMEVLRRYAAGDERRATAGGSVEESVRSPAASPVRGAQLGTPAERSRSGLSAAELDVEGTAEADTLRLGDTGGNSIVWEMAELANNDMVLDYVGEVARFTAGGSLGIGTGATVDQRLHVNGTAQVNTLRLEDTAGNSIHWEVAEDVQNALVFSYVGTEMKVSSTGVLSVASLAGGSMTFVCITPSNEFANCGANPLEELKRLDEIVEAQRARIDQLERTLAVRE